MQHKLGNHAQVQRSVDGMNLWLGRAGLSIAVGVAYFLAAQLGLSLLTTAERVAVFWPASGVAAGALIAEEAGCWVRRPRLTSPLAGGPSDDERLAAWTCAGTLELSGKFPL